MNWFVFEKLNILVGFLLNLFSKLKPHLVRKLLLEVAEIEFLFHVLVSDQLSNLIIKFKGDVVLFLNLVQSLNF